MGLGWMSVNMFDPHPPFDPPSAYLDRFNKDSLPGPWFEEGDLEAQAKFGQSGVSDWIAPSGRV